MKIETKFDLGQYVYVIWQRRGKAFEPCPYCQETGRLETPAGSVLCPKCSGQKGKVIFTPEKWEVTDSGTIGNVRAERYDPSCDIDDETSYMLDTTGIGSGALWPEDRLFATREEAEAECARRNAEAAK